MASSDKGGKGSWVKFISRYYMHIPSSFKVAEINFDIDLTRLRALRHVGWG